MFIWRTAMTVVAVAVAVVVIVVVVSAPLSCWSKTGHVTSVGELPVTDTASPPSSCLLRCHYR